MTTVERGCEAAFSAEEFARRQRAARQALAEQDIDVAIVTGPENIFYLTGQQTPGYYTFQALLLPVEGEPRFIVRRLEAANCTANSYLEHLEIYDDGADPVALLTNLIARLGWQERQIGIDKRGWFLPVAAYETLRDQLGAIGNVAGVIERLRAVKSAAEIERIQKAAAYVDAGMTAGLTALRTAANENHLVAAMMAGAIAAGSEYVGMEPLVSSGCRTGVPHGTWRRRPLEAGDPVFLEMAACHDRYHAVLMRSAWIGEPPTEAARMMETCQEALESALQALRPDNTCEDVHRAAQRVIDRAGYTEQYRKRSGYSVGISFPPDWGEGNVLSLYSGVEVELRPGMAFHIPIALRDYGRFTVGVSETAVVTADGCRMLSGVARDLFIV